MLYKLVAVFYVVLYSWQVYCLLSKESFLFCYLLNLQQLCHFYVVKW